MLITGIILAGGKSSRMGADKALMKIGEKSLLDNAVEICKLISTSIVISSNNLKHKVENYPIVKDEIPDCGPMGGIYSCLKQSESDWNFVLSVDSPFVQLEFIRSLIPDNSGFDAIVPVSSSGNEPLIAFYHKNILPEVEKRITNGNFKLIDLLYHVNTSFVDAHAWEEKYPKLFNNINRPGDLS